MYDKLAMTVLNIRCTCMVEEPSHVKQRQSVLTWIEPGHVLKDEYVAGDEFASWSVPLYSQTLGTGWGWDYGAAT
jgi:hypothetical protein